MKREELNFYDCNEGTGEPINLVYDKEEADKVFDDYEKRIKELENKSKNLQYSSDMWMACCKLMSEGKRNVMSSEALAEMNRIKELEAENERLKEQVASAQNLIDVANEHLESYKNKLAARTTPKAVCDTIAELREENARLKAQVPKWISVKDRLPDEGEFILAKKRNVLNGFIYDIDVICFNMTYITGFVITHWMPLPPPPTTEESSETEKENG